jgi:hypothetical protein
MLETTIAGSLPKPSWLAEPRKLWAPWRQEGEALADAKRDATILALKLQEDAGIDIVSDGEQSRQHFVHATTAMRPIARPSPAPLGGGLASMRRTRGSPGRTPCMRSNSRCRGR